MGIMAKHRMSFFGEFVDKSLEAQFLDDALSGSRKLTAYLSLVFGAVLGLFVVQSSLVERHTSPFLQITLVRLVFVLISLGVFFKARRIAKHQHLVYLVTFYQVLMVTTYLLTLKYYDTLNFFSILAFLVLTMALYLLPNKLAFSQLISLVFSAAFFLAPAKKLDGLQTSHLLRTAAYQAILIIYCNINGYWAGINRRRTFLANRELLEVSAKDPLTGLYNRKKFDDALDQWVRTAQTSDRPLSLILFDVDDFKGINDQRGHMVGDAVLKEIAARATGSIRKSDILARWGGDEFTILLPDTDLEEAQKLAERVRSSLLAGGFAAVDSITCSFGATAYEPGDTKHSLLRRVDDLLRQAKCCGKDRVVS